MKYVVVTYSVHLGYKKDYEELKCKLMDHPLVKGHLIMWCVESDCKDCDVFEVDLVNVEMLHSKKNGDGLPDTNAKIDEIALKIKSHM